MQQALNAMEEFLRHPDRQACSGTINAMRARLAEPDDEPVARVAEVHMSRYTLEWTNGPVPEGSPLYTRPAARKVQPLTDEQCDSVILEMGLTYLSDVSASNRSVLHALCRRAHGITGDSHD